MVLLGGLHFENATHFVKKKKMEFTKNVG